MTETTPRMPDGAPAIRTIAMPADTNSAGDIFGGWLMAQMDLAAGNVAARRAKGRTVTASVEAISFISPVYVGDEVSLFADIVKIGRSSIRINVAAWRRDRTGSEAVKVTQAVFTCVAVDRDGHSCPLPPEGA